MSFQFPPSDRELKFPPQTIMPTLPITTEDTVELVPVSRRSCTIGICDGLTTSETHFDLPDGEPETSGTIRYDNRTLDSEDIKGIVPEPFKEFVAQTLGPVTQDFYRENISEIIISWNL